MGAICADPDGTHARNPAAGVRERHDVRDAPLRGTNGARVLARRTALVLLPIGLAWAHFAERRQLTGYGVAGSNNMGNGSLLYVAHNAGGSIGAVPARRRGADGADGDGRHVVGFLRAAPDRKGIRLL